jgi:hypothetical protein
MAGDPLGDCVNLEDQFYQGGYKQGYEDGARAGRLEGRSLGMEKGFEKFSDSARLHGKAIIWANRIPGVKPRKEQGLAAHPATEPCDEPATTDASATHQQSRGLPDLPYNARIVRHVSILKSLVEPGSLSTENTDDAVDDFDERMRKAQGKAKIIEKMVSDDLAKEKTENVDEGSKPMQKLAELI